MERVISSSDAKGSIPRHRVLRETNSRFALPHNRKVKALRRGSSGRPTKAGGPVIIESDMNHLGTHLALVRRSMMCH
jgi:hypothetical protein